MQEYYSRIRAIVGESLREKRVMLLAPGYCARVAELLAACGVTRWIIPANNDLVSEDEPLARYYDKKHVGMPARNALQVWLRLHHPEDECWEWSNEGKPDLIAGEIRQARDLARLAKRYGVHALALGLPRDTACRGIIGCLPPGQNLPDYSDLPWHQPADVQLCDWLDLSEMAAMLAKAILLEGTPYARADLTRLLYPQGTLVALGSASWPWQLAYLPLSERGPLGQQGAARRLPKIGQERVLIVGCGSLGSQIARGLLAAGVNELILIDGETVDMANPIRQFYHPSQAGMAKVAALSENLRRLAPSVKLHSLNMLLEDTPAGRRSWKRLLDRYQPALVILATGTSIEYVLAKTARRQDRKHLAVRCYARARYWEAVIVDGRRGPCLDCLRGHLYSGPAPRLTPEEESAYVRGGLHELSGEPATLVESGHAATGMLRLALAFLAGEPPSWFRRALMEQSTCFLGGTHAEQLSSGVWAYHIRYPGQVLRLGTNQIAGISYRCPTCGRINQAALAYESPPLDLLMQAALRIEIGGA